MDGSVPLADWCWLPCGRAQGKNAQVLATLRFCRLRHGRSFRVGGSWAWLGTVPVTICSSRGRGTEEVPGSSRMEDRPLCSLFLWPIASVLSS